MLQYRLYYDINHYAALKVGSGPILAYYGYLYKDWNPLPETISFSKHAWHTCESENKTVTPMY